MRDPKRRAILHITHQLQRTLGRRRVGLEVATTAAPIGRDGQAPVSLQLDPRPETGLSTAIHPGALRPATVRLMIENEPSLHRCAALGTRRFSVCHGITSLVMFVRAQPNAWSQAAKDAHRGLNLEQVADATACTATFGGRRERAEDAVDRQRWDNRRRDSPAVDGDCSCELMFSDR